MTELMPSIKDKLSRGEPISELDALELYACTDLLTLGQLAQLATPEDLAGQCTIINVRRVRYSNICRNRCRHCARAKEPGEEGAYTRSAAEVRDLVGAAVEMGIDQVQLVGGANPAPPYEYYLDVVRTVRESFPHLHLQGFAPAQLAAIATTAERSFRHVLKDLREAGLDSILEDGADIFDPKIRRILCPAKASGGTWLQVMREAHEEGVLGGAGMLYGHFEGPDEKVEHLSRLRDLQEETGGFRFFAPRAFRVNGKSALDSPLIGGTEDMREFAVGRAFLNDFPHIRCYANDLGMKSTQIALQFGVDTIVVVVHDSEPVADEDRAARGMPNAAQLHDLATRAGFTVLAAALDQRAGVTQPAQ